MNKLLLFPIFLFFLSPAINAQTIITVGDGGTEYLNLKEAFDDINLGNVTGDIVLQIIDNCTQAGTAVLYQTGYLGNSDYSSITIYPVAAGFSITGNVNGPLIDLNGATNVTFNGRINATGTPDLTIVNSNTGTLATTVSFFASAANNVVEYCTIKGSGTGLLNGIIYFNNGNTGNTISHNSVTSASGRPINALYSTGTSLQNSGNTISSNNFYDVLNKGTASSIINLSSFNTGWTISGNSFYETSTFIPAAAIQLNVININNPSGSGFNISGNFIGGNASSCSGTWNKTNASDNVFNAINLNVGTATASEVQNNTIANFSWSNSGSAAWTAINIAAGNVNVGTTIGNTIGASTGTGSIIVSGGATGTDVFGINIQGSGSVTASNNSIGSVTALNSGTFAANFYGINKTATAGTTIITNNAIGSETTANSVNSPSASTANIQLVYGIKSSGTGNVSISGNTVAGLSNATTNTSGLITGLSFNGGSGTNSINKNFIRLTPATGTPAVNGISLTKGIVTCSNNILTLSGNTQSVFTGIYTSGIAGDNNNLYYNTVYIGGNPASGAANSYALYVNTSADSRDIRDNLLINGRSNSGATGKHYSAFFNSAGGTLTCNYNNYYVSGTGGTLGYYSGDKTALPITGGDGNSISADPLFSYPGGDAYSDYRISNGTLVAGVAIAVTDDYTGLGRASTPTIGALEAGSCSNPVSGGSVAANQSGCSPFNPAIITSSSLPTGYIGTLEYKWQSSTTGAGSGFTDIPGATAATYDPSSITVSTWYKRVSRVTCAADWSGAAETNVIAVTVNSAPVAIAITGGNALCMGNTLNLTSNATGTPTLTYTWSSSNTSVATISNVGLVTSVGPGITNITYTVSDGNTPSCQATSPVFAVTVNSVPVANPITGTNEVCSNGTLTLTSNATGTAPLSYTWSSTDAFVATINNSGIVDPNNQGSTEIRYTVTDGSATGCSAASSPFILGVKDAPVAGAITGTNSLCPGNTTTLSSHATGAPVLTYTWSSSNTAVATVDNTGLVTALSAGTTNITYTATDGNIIHCSSVSPAFVFTVNPLPNANLVIGGSGAVCSGTGTNITVDLSETGVTYQLRDAAGNINTGTPVAGTGGTINLPTGNLTAAITFNILATNISSTCSVQLNETETITVDAPSVGGTISGGAASLVYGSSTGTMTLSGHTGLIVKWQKQLDAGSWTDITNTSATYSETPASTGSFKYRVKVKSGVCPDVLSTESSTNVTPKPLTVIANNQTKIYGTIYTFTGSEFSVTGLISGDAITSVTLSSAGAPASASVASSPYTITPSTAIGTGLSNYTITYTDGSFTVNPAPLTITASNQSKTYGTAFTFAGTEFTVNGLQPGDAVSSVTLASSGSATNAAVTGSPYPVIPSSATGTGLSNYTISYVSGAFTINRAELTITALNQSKTYGSTFTFAGTEFTSAGLITGDAVIGTTLTSSGSAATAGVSGSPYSIVPSAATGTGLSNYTITYANGSFVVNKAVITATADNKSRNYGENNPEFTITYTGFANSENQAVIDQQPLLQTTASQNSSTGTYPITVTGGNDNNYSFTYVNGTLTINKAVQIITFTDLPEKIKPGTGYTLTAVSSAGLTVAFESLDPSVATVSGNTLTGISKGTVQVRAFNTGNQNFNPAEAIASIEIIGSHKDILNLFTPNGDGFNDYWELPKMNEWGKCDVRVYNRWGKLVYANPDYNNLWDGTSNGAPLPEGAYYFIINTENSGVVKGTLNIVR